MLLERGATITKTAKVKIDKLAKENEDMKKLTKKNKNIKEKDKDQLLIKEIQGGNIINTMNLVDYGANVNYKDEKGLTA